MTASFTPAGRRFRVLVVDDHPLYRAGLIQFISQQRNLVCCGHADTAAAALEMVDAFKPDLALLDLRLQREDCLALIRTLHARLPRLRLLVLSQGDELKCVERALRAGAQGYVLKEEATDVLLEAIRSVLTGESFVSRKVACAILN